MAAQTNITNRKQHTSANSMWGLDKWPGKEQSHLISHATLNYLANSDQNPARLSVNGYQLAIIPNVIQLSAQI